jgi:AcrR family transcriptional regulator
MSRHTAAGRPARADARQNVDRIVAAATRAFLGDRADVSLEEIARRANVGSATLHRHFPTRQALLEAVFHEQVAALCARAESLAASTGASRDVLIEWLRHLGRFVADTRGIAAALLLDLPQDDQQFAPDSCRSQLEKAGGVLLGRARVANAVRGDVAIGELLDLVNALSSVPGRDQEQSDRLVLLALDGMGGR